MSLRYEQYWSLKRTRDFLRRLLTTKRPKTIHELKEQASRCLKHFPGLMDSGKPFFSMDEFTDKDGNPTAFNRKPFKEKDESE